MSTTDLRAAAVDAVMDHLWSPPLDKPRPGGPALPATYTASDDVNPICGCHLRSKCMSCGQCTTCDACYCGED